MFKNVKSVNSIFLQRWGNGRVKIFKQIFFRLWVKYFQTMSVECPPGVPAGHIEQSLRFKNSKLKLKNSISNFIQASSRQHTSSKTTKRRMSSWWRGQRRFAAVSRCVVIVAPEEISSSGLWISNLINRYTIYMFCMHVLFAQLNVCLSIKT